MRFLNSILGFIDRHRNLCKKCPDNIKGLCCHISEVIEGYNIILPNQPCKFLNLETKTCTVHKERFKKNKRCTPIKAAIRDGGYPHGCRYLKHNYNLVKVPPKIHYETVKDNLSTIGKQTFELMNTSPQKYIIKY